MKISVVDFNYVRAITDARTREIFISREVLCSASVIDDMRHELTHLVSGDCDHGDDWCEVGREFGIMPPEVDMFKQYRHRLGVPAHLAANVGNITGIQNMLTDLHLLAAYRKFCIDIETPVMTPTGDRIASDLKLGDLVLSMNDTGSIEERQITEIFDNGESECYDTTIDDGRHIISTPSHRLFTKSGLKAVELMSVNDMLMQPSDRNMASGKVVDIRHVGKRKTIDFCVPPCHNYLAAGCLSHNSQKILATEGHWEVVGEVEGTGVNGDSSAGEQLIRLYPTPKGAYPVVVLYYPVVTHWRSPQARKLAMDMLLAECKIMVGHARRKIANMPAPGSGTIGMDGTELVTEGIKEKDEITQKALDYGEPPQIMLF